MTDKHSFFRPSVHPSSVTLHGTTNRPVSSRRIPMSIGIYSHCADQPAYRIDSPSGPLKWLDIDWSMDADVTHAHSKGYIVSRSKPLPFTSSSRVTSSTRCWSIKEPPSGGKLLFRLISDALLLRACRRLVADKVQNTCPKTCRSATIEICRLIYTIGFHTTLCIECIIIIILLPVNAKPEACKCDGDECMRQRALTGLTNNDVYISFNATQRTR